MVSAIVPPDGDLVLIFPPLLSGCHEEHHVCYQEPSLTKLCRKPRVSQIPQMAYHQLTIRCACQMVHHRGLGIDDLDHGTTGETFKESADRRAGKE